MKLITDRIIIRSFRFEDNVDLFEMLSDKHTARDSGWNLHKTIVDSHNAITAHIYDADTFVVALKNNLMIGTISLYDHSTKTKIIKELGFCLNRKYRGKGYMYEAINILINHAFREMNVSIINTCHSTDNDNCRKLIKKFPFDSIGIKKEYKELCDGVICDVELYEMNIEKYDKFIKGEII